MHSKGSSWFNENPPVFNVCAQVRRKNALPQIASCRGTINIDSTLRNPASGHLPDTYINVRGWGKGLAFINGFNLGWYWPLMGPQGTQYIPGPLLKAGSNEIILVETELAPSSKSGEANLSSKA